MYISIAKDIGKILRVWEAIQMTIRREKLLTSINTKIVITCNQCCIAPPLHTKNMCFDFTWVQIQQKEENLFLSSTILPKEDTLF